MRKINSIIFLILLAAMTSIGAFAATRNISVNMKVESELTVRCVDGTLILLDNDGEYAHLQCISLIPAPTNTPLPTDTIAPTLTSEPTATESPTYTSTPEPTSTNTLIPTETSTVQPTNTNTAIPTATSTATATSTNTATNVPTSTSTATPIPPTATSTSTATLVPTATSTSTPVPTNTATNTPSAPIALKDYQPCPTHDITAWHSTIDSVRQCHYDHSHGDNPALADDIFGTWTFGANTISYPHASSPAENMYEQYISSVNTGKKHAGYFYIVRRNLPDSPVALPNWNTPVNSHIRDVRCQIHFWGSGDTLVRFHSYYCDIRVQNKTTGAYGIIRSGGLMDTGILELYKLQWIPVAGQDPTAAQLTKQWLPGYDANIHDSIDPYRGYKQTCAQIQSRFGTANFWSPTYNMTLDNTGLSSDVLWSLAPNVHGYNRIAAISVEKFDNPDCINAGPVNKTNPYSATYEVLDVCTLGGRPNCRLNGTEVAMFMGFTIVPQSWDNSAMDTNPISGIVTMNAWTNSKQEIVNGCTVGGFDCVPLILKDMPVGQGFFQWNGNGKQMVTEFDLTPPDRLVNGQWQSWHKQ